MLDKEKCAVFIPTYKRADNVLTYKTLKNGGYDGKIYLILGDDDPSIEEYKKKYKEKVVVFHKDRNKTDLMDNFDKDNVVVFARNEMFEIAKKLCLDYFMVLDDDYDHFCFRRCYGDVLKGFKIKDLNTCIWCGFDYIHNTNNLDCFTWCQDGDFIGGANGFEKIGGKRKIMNAYFFKTNTPIKFLGRTNEDLTASVYNGQRGKCLFTVNDISVHQMITQKQSGGLTDSYLDMGTYVKSFYSVIACPNCVKIGVMGSVDYRIHHNVNWNLAVPKIIREIYKK